MTKVKHSNKLVNTCLYCLRSDREFKSEEHTIPRGLGNEKHILPRGVVCDSCNNEILSYLDSILLEFDPIKFNRAFYGAITRKGNPVAYKSAGFHMAHTTRDHIQLNALDSSKSVTNMTDNGFTINTRSSRKLTVDYLKLLARALYKIGLGLVYLDLGAEVAMSSRFDEVRKIILGECDFNGYLMVNRKPELESTGTVLHWDKTIEGKRISIFRFYFYGVDILYDMENRNVELPSDLSDERINLLKF